MHNRGCDISELPEYINGTWVALVQQSTLCDFESQVSLVFIFRVYAFFFFCVFAGAQYANDGRYRGHRGVQYCWRPLGDDGANVAGPVQHNRVCRVCDFRRLHQAGAKVLRCPCQLSGLQGIYSRFLLAIKVVFLHRSGYTFIRRRIGRSSTSSSSEWSRQPSS